MVMKMDENSFAQRLASLRMKKTISAREMSLALGQNPSYINRIENGRAYPSMQCFFYICEYLGVTPAEFFDPLNADPGRQRRAAEDLRHLDARQLDIIQAIIDEFLSTQR